MFLVRLRNWLSTQDPYETGPVQYGAMPYRFTQSDRLEVLLINSRGRKQWIVPKGGLIGGKTAWQSAEIEALEEAGVEGEIEASPLGSYRLPITRERPWPTTVVLYPLCVRAVMRSWKEDHQRERRWAEIGRARTMVRNRGLRRVIGQLPAHIAT